MSPPDPRTRQEPGGGPRLLSRIDGTTIATPQGTTRTRIAGRPRDAADDLLAAIGPVGARRWWVDLGCHLGVVPAALVVDLAGVPALATELAQALDAERRTELVAEIERAVVAAVAVLQAVAA